MEDPVPQRLGRYHVVRHLATGGMAQVLLAYTHTPGGVDYQVLKRVRPDQAQDGRFVRMFLDEARLAALLRHPNIVQVFEIGEQAGDYFFAMEYVHGEDLRRVLMEVSRASDKVPIALITGIVAAIAEGLHYAHQLVGPDRQPLHIVHRDVSPANILIGYDGAVKLADFGIAKAALHTVETRSGTLKGKVSYMSPEQVTGKRIDRRSDVFALGIVLYELATARRLFKGDNDFLTMSAIVQGDIPLPSLQRPDLPRSLEEIIMKALADEPRDRFQSADELRIALEKFTDTLGMRMSRGSIADYMKKLFGYREQPWLVPDEPTITAPTDFDGSASGVATIQSTGMPNVQASPSSPLVYARTGVTGRPATAPVQGWVDPAALAWSREPTRDGGRRRLGILLGMAIVAAIAGAGMAIFSRTGSLDDRTSAPVATTPSPPPAPPTAETIVIEPAPAPVVTPPPPEPVVAPPPEPVVAPPPEPVEAQPAPEPEAIGKPAGKPRVRKVVRKPRPDPKKNQNWDPNALFPK